MQAQEMTWGWTMRICLGVLWRWAVATIAAAFALAGIVVISGRIVGQPDLRHDPIFPKMLIATWLLLFLWAFGAALRSKHGRFRIALVPIDNEISADLKNSSIATRNQNELTTQPKFQPAFGGTDRDTAGTQHGARSLSESWRKRGWRIASWLFLTFAVFLLARPASFFLAEHHWRFPWQFLYVVLAVADLLLAWGVGLIGRQVRWSVRARILILSAALPAIDYFFMLYLGCALWNTLAGRYECGL